MDIPCFFAGSITATKITIGFGGLVITGLSATGGAAFAAAVIVAAGVLVGIAVVSGGLMYLLFKEYKTKNM